MDAAKDTVDDLTAVKNGDTVKDSSPSENINTKSSDMNAPAVPGSSKKVEASPEGSSEGIRKRSSSSQKRNYRQNHSTEKIYSSDEEEISNEQQLQGHKDKSNEISEKKDCVSTGGIKLNDKNKDSSSLDNMEEQEQPVTPMSVETEDIPSPVAPSPDVGDGHDDSSNHSNSDLTESIDSDSDEHIVPRRLAHYPAGMSSSSSSSSTSLHFMEEEDGLEADTTDDSSDDLEDLEPSVSMPRARGGALTKDTSNDHDDDEMTETVAKKKKIEPKKKALPQVLLKPKPKCSWSGPREVFRREMGYSGRKQPQSAEVFRSKFYGSLFSAERLELMKKLDGHTGCVNCLSFNFSGTKLATGSDDLSIKIWNYGLGQLLTSFNSGHRANVFQAKFLPLLGQQEFIVSCSRDCQVLLTELDSTGNVASSRKLAQHRGAAHKLTVGPENPQVILSCGEDGVVYSIDIREEKPQKLLSLREKGKRVALYSINGNPLNSREFCVAGRDEFVRIYDIRKLSFSTTNVPGNGIGDEPRDGPSNDDSPAVKKFCPHHLTDSRSKPHVTAAVYNYNGKEIVGSYNDENIYLFDSTHSDMADCIKVYEGHRNSATVKGINFFGDRSQFIVSGSDCGHVFIWDKDTESIVNFFRGDENGVVNCLEPHPSAPILATSGLDDDVKIWIPSSEQAPKMGDLAPTVRKNFRRRKEELERQPDQLDGHIMWALWSHLQRANRNRRNAGEVADEDSDSDNSWSHAPEDDDEGDGEEDGARGVECAIS